MLFSITSQSHRSHAPFGYKENFFCITQQNDNIVITVLEITVLEITELEITDLLCMRV